MVNFDGKSLLITGGTGSFGRKFVEVMLMKHNLKKLVIFSRDELKHFEMRTSELFRPSKFTLLSGMLGIETDCFEHSQI